MAAATQERRLLGVGSSAWFGAGLPRGSALAYTGPTPPPLMTVSSSKRPGAVSESRLRRRKRHSGQSAFNVFEVPGNTQAHVQTPMFGRGRLDHFGLNARSRETFEHVRTRLMQLGASDGTITDFGAALSVFFRDPDGLEAEVV